MFSNVYRIRWVFSNDCLFLLISLYVSFTTGFKNTNKMFSTYFTNLIQRTTVETGGEKLPKTILSCVCKQ